MLQYIRFVPNILSTLRLILAGVFPFAPEPVWLWLIIGSGVSDVLDGWIARRWQVQSRLGAILDAVADKLFILVALLTIALAGKLPPPGHGSPFTGWRSGGPVKSQLPDSSSCCWSLSYSRLE